jgi:hypothetical protein
MKNRFYKSLENSTEARALFVLLVVYALSARRTIAALFPAAINWLYYRELYIFPPVAFVADYTWMSRIFPHHPISELAILATAFMSMTLTLFLLRPPTRRIKAHWIKA